jgi:hypothetical protein
MESVSLRQIISATHQGFQGRRELANPNPIHRRRRIHTQTGRFCFPVLSKKSDFQGIYILTILFSMEKEETEQWLDPTKPLQFLTLLVEWPVLPCRNDLKIYSDYSNL